MNKLNKSTIEKKQEAIKEFQEFCTSMDAMETFNEVFRSFISDTSRLDFIDQADFNKENSTASFMIEKVIKLLYQLEQE